MDESMDEPAEDVRPKSTMRIPKFTREEATRHTQAIFEQDLPSMLQRGPKLPWETGIMATIFWKWRPTWATFPAGGCSCRDQ